MAYTYRYPRPAVTVDMAILVARGTGHEVLLIQRRDDPFQGLWALPGGFLDMDEELEEAAARELEEETGLTGIPLQEIGAFGKIGRDPRGRTVSVVYLAVLEDRFRDERIPDWAGFPGRGDGIDASDIHANRDALLGVIKSARSFYGETGE